MESITSQTFDKILSKSVHLKQCKYCHTAFAEIVVKLPWYGRYGAMVKCSHCGAETPIHGVTLCVTSGKTLGTPTLYSSMISGIKKAVADWNNGLYGYRAKGKKDLKDEEGNIIYQ